MPQPAYADHAGGCLHDLYDRRLPRWRRYPDVDASGAGPARAGELRRVPCGAFLEGGRDGMSAVPQQHLQQSIAPRAGPTGADRVPFNEGCLAPDRLACPACDPARCTAAHDSGARSDAPRLVQPPRLRRSCGCLGTAAGSGWRGAHRSRAERGHRHAAPVLTPGAPRPSLHGVPQQRAAARRRVDPIDPRLPGVPPRCYATEDL